MLYTLHPESFTPRKFNEAEPENPAFQQHSPFPGFDLQLKHVKLQWCKHLTPATSHQTGSRKQKQEEAGDTQLAGSCFLLEFRVFETGSVHSQACRVSTLPETKAFSSHLKAWILRR